MDFVKNFTGGNKNDNANQAQQQAPPEAGGSFMDNLTNKVSFLTSSTSSNSLTLLRPTAWREEVSRERETRTGLTRARSPSNTLNYSTELTSSQLSTSSKRSS
jgi:hypothetical protein